MKRVKRTEITIETEEVFILRGETNHPATPEGPGHVCETCGARVQMLHREINVIKKVAANVSPEGGESHAEEACERER